MASRQPLPALMGIAANLTQSLSTAERYQQLLAAVHQLLPCDASALLRLEGDTLRPVACQGLTPDTLGRRFAPAEHPRLAAILRSREPVRFDCDCGLPDPYDGLVCEHQGDLNVHDCLGASLFIRDRQWGVLTLDSLEVGRFGDIDDVTLDALISLTAATVGVAEWLEALESQLDRQRQLTSAMITEQFQHHPDEIIGDSDAMDQVRRDIASVATSDLTALISGESGTGKELVAREIHRQSQRSGQALVYVNCAALPDNLVESELFGHVKGAFSGAVSNRAGKFELAHKGSLFLDEVGELPFAAQAKLLRALQFGEIQRLGADRSLQVDVRIIAATNRNLQEEVKAGRFRADLYHRLCVYPIWVPPLSERGEDIVKLSGFFLENIRSRLGVRSLRLTTSARKAIANYTWPGNVRELEHTLSRASLRARQLQQHGDIVSITPVELALEPGAESARESVEQMAAALELPETRLSLADATDEFQRRLIEQRVREADNNWAKAARGLDMNRSNLHRLAKRLGLK